MQPMVRTPFNYTGNKYRLLPQLLPLFPPAEQTPLFLDVFFGGGTVSLNVPYKKIHATETIRPLVAVHKFLTHRSFASIEKKIRAITKDFGLTCSAFAPIPGDKHELNKDPYLKLRTQYNKNKRADLLLVLLMYSFNNNLRFNPKGEFNVPVGKRDYNKSVQHSLQEYIAALSSKEFSLHAKDYTTASQVIEPDSFVYADPPYLITKAQYNAGWSSAEDLRLMKWLDEVSRSGSKFCLSNVLSAKGRKNNPLITWAKRYTIIELSIDYGNSCYNKIAKEPYQEVAILNYKP